MGFVYGIGLPDSRCLVSLKVSTIRISLRDCLPRIPFGTLKLKISTYIALNLHCSGNSAKSLELSLTLQDRLFVSDHFKNNIAF